MILALLSGFEINTVLFLLHLFPSHADVFGIICPNIVVFKTISGKQ